MKSFVSSGIDQLDVLLGGGILIGDNVIWYDTAGSLAPVFNLNLIQISQEQKKELIYISFDRSPRSLLEKLGPFTQNKRLTILDCFTHGKGESSDTFLAFYENLPKKLSCRIIKEEDPLSPDRVKEAVYGLHETMKEDVRLIFDSLTGMQELWGEEETVLRFYSQACPHLYELNTEAYWIVESEAHSSQFKAHINKVTQVAIDLELKRGKTSLTLIKAEGRDVSTLEIPVEYWSDGMEVNLNLGGDKPRKLALGAHLKRLRKTKGLSQTALARLVGVTPSMISQVESDQIYPAIPALIKIAEILSVEIGSLFGESLTPSSDAVVFSSQDATSTTLPHLPQEEIHAMRLLPEGSQHDFEGYLLEIQPKSRVESHFFINKAVEIGYLLSGNLHLQINGKEQSMQQGDLVTFGAAVPECWENRGDTIAKLLWFHIRKDTDR